LKVLRCCGKFLLVLKYSGSSREVEVDSGTAVKCFGSCNRFLNTLEGCQRIMGILEGSGRLLVFWKLLGVSV
jgi:hypothetical protein